jgi:hypothetical protein
MEWIMSTDINIFNLYGGLDTRDKFSNENPNIVFFTEGKNFDIFGTNVRKTRGQTEKLQIPDVSILGLSQHEINGIFYLRAIADNGSYYRIDPSSGIYTAVKTGLSTSAKPYFFQYSNKLICLTGHDDPFVDDGTSISQTGFYDQYSRYGTIGCAFHGHIFIADGSLLAWSAVNTTDDWSSESDAGYKDDFIGNIIGLKVFSNYLLIRTTSDMYLMSGYDNADFQVEHYSTKGTSSRFADCELDNKLYVWNNGLYPIETMGDMAQIRINDPLSLRVTPSLTEIDKTRIDEIILVSYEDRKQIWAYVPIEDTQGIYKAWIANFINYDKGIISLYPREGNPITCACSFDGKIYSGTSDGKIYLEDSGNTFDGNPIESYWWIEPQTFGSSRMKICSGEFKAWFSAFSVNRCSFNFRYDGDFSNPDDEDVDILDVHDDYFILDEDELNGSSVLAVGDKTSEIIMCSDEFTICQFGISTENEDDDYIFYGGSFINLRLSNEY